MTDKIEQILKELEPLFKEAEETGKWFYCNYQQLWFSPSELRKQHNEGYFIWGGINWQLRDPREAIEEIDAKIRNIERERDSLARRIVQKN